MPFFRWLPDELKNGAFTFYCPEVHKTQTYWMIQSTLVAAEAFLFGAKAPRSGPIFGVSNKNCALDRNKRSDMAIPERGLSKLVVALGSAVEVENLSTHDRRY